MKKRRILLGVALAATAMFALASCGDNSGSSSKANAGTNVLQPTNTPTGGKTTGGQATPSKTSEAPAAEKYDVKFYDADGTTELASQKVTEGEKATAPAVTAPAGKRFDYWTLKGKTNAYSLNTAITEDINLQAVYADATVYDTMKADTNNVIAYDFYNQAIAEGTTWSETAAVVAAAGNASISANNKLALAKNTAYMAFGKTLGNGIIKVSFEIETAGNDKEAFFVVDGTSADKLEHGNVFALRDTKGPLNYRFEDSTADVAITGATNAVNTKYLYEVTINTAEGKISISRDGAVVASDIATTINSVSGIKFSAKSGGTTAKTIDNVAVTFEEIKKSELQIAKDAATKAVDDYLASAAYTDAKAAVKTLISSKATAIKKSIATAEDANALGVVTNDWTNFANANKYVLTVKAYSAANTPIEGVADYEIAAVDGTNMDLSKVSFTGYNAKICTTAALDVEAVNFAIAQDTTYYAICTEVKGGTWECSSLTAADDKEALAAGSLDAFFTLVGTATVKRTNSSGAVASIELGKSLASYVTFTTTEQATVTIVVGSTGTSNITTGVGLYTDVTNKTVAKDINDVSCVKDVTGGTGSDTLTFTVAAGTYYFGATESGRVVRLTSISVGYAD